MARKYDVTRNFEIYEVKCVLFNDKTDGTEKISFQGDNKDISKKSLEKYIKLTKGDHYTLVKFEVQPIGSVMYGMTSNDFMKYGVRLNPENRQPIDQEPEQNTDQVPEQNTDQVPEDEQ